MDLNNLFDIYDKIPHNVRTVREALVSSPQLITERLKMHKFEKAGFVGPFKLKTIVSLPSPAVGASNPEAYQSELKSSFEVAGKFGVGLGSCDVCGQPLVHNAIVSCDSGSFTVGLDCAQHIGDPCLADVAKVEQANIVREQGRIRREAKREAKRQVWLNSKTSTGETNLEKLDREAAERRAEREAIEKRKEARKEILEPIAKVLEDGKNGFRDSVAKGLRRGVAPSGNGLFIACEIFGKASGRRGSAKFNEAFSQAEKIFANAEKVA